MSVIGTFFMAAFAIGVIGTIIFIVITILLGIIDYIFQDK